MKNKKLLKIKLLVLFILMAAYIIGCGSVINEAEKSSETIEESENLIKVGFSQLGSESVWRVAHSDSMITNLSKENGFSLVFNNARQKQENQIKAIRGFIAEGVDYIVFSPVTADGWDTVLQEANEAGIPTILADRKISTSNKNLYTTWIGADAKLEGEKAAKWLEEYLKKQSRANEEINIVVLQGTIGSSVQLGRTIGFDSISDTHSNWKILDQKSGDFTTAKAKEVMKEFLSKYDDIDVLVSQNDDMTFGAIQTMDEMGITYGEDGDIIVISFDAVHEALEYVQQGKINVDVECNPEEGEYVADIIKRLEKGEAVSKENVVDELIFTKDNVDKYIDNRSY